MWRRGSVVGSWLLDLTAIALNESPDLHEFSGRVSDSGEGRWTAIAAIDEGVPAPVLTTALQSRFASRSLDDFANKALSAMRKQFGGHAEKPGVGWLAASGSCRSRRERHHDVAEGVVVVAGRGVPGTGQFDELRVGHGLQEVPTPSGLTTSESLPRISSTGIVRSAAACSKFSVRSSGSSPGLVMKAGSQCQYQRPSRSRRFFFSPSGLRGLVRCGRYAATASAASSRVANPCSPLNMKSRMRALPFFSNRGTTSTSTSLVTSSGPARSRGEDAGEAAHAGPDQHHRPADRVEHLHDVGGQRLDVVVGVGGPVAVTVAAAVQRDHVETVVGQDLAGVLPGVPVLAAAVQHEDARAIGGYVGATR